MEHRCLGGEIELGSDEAKGLFCDVFVDSRSMPIVPLHDVVGSSISLTIHGYVDTAQASRSASLDLLESLSLERRRQAEVLGCHPSGTNSSLLMAEP